MIPHFAGANEHRRLSYDWVTKNQDELVEKRVAAAQQMFAKHEAEQAEKGKTAVPRRDARHVEDPQLSAMDAAAPADHWSEWRRALGEGGLVSYRYLGCSSTARSRHTAEGGMRLRRDLRTAGGLLAAPLGIALLDTAGINVDALGRCAPTQIDVTVFEPAHDVDEVRIFGQIVREGRSQMFTQGRFEDRRDRAASSASAPRVGR